MTQVEITVPEGRATLGGRGRGGPGSGCVSEAFPVAETLLCASPCPLPELAISGQGQLLLGFQAVPK